MLRAPAPFLIFAVVVGLGACRQLAGIEDIELSSDAGTEGGRKMEGGIKDAPEPAEAGACGCDTCETLATGQESPLSMVLVGSDIYFLNYGPETGLGSLAHVSTSGGKVETIVGDLTHPLSLTTDGTNLYWYTEDPKNGGLIEKHPISGGGGTVELAMNQETMSGLIFSGTIQFPTTQFIAVSATDVYWIGAAGGAGVNVMKVPIGGGPSTAFVNAIPGEGGLADSFVPVSILTDGKSLYVISSGADYTGIFEVSLSTGVGTSLIDNLTSPYNLALTPTDVLFVDDAMMFTNGTLQSIPRSGGATKVLANGLAAPWGVTADATDAYWINSGNGCALGSLEKVPLGGGKAVTLVPEANAPEALAIDSANVYWVDSTCGTVMKVAK